MQKMKTGSLLVLTGLLATSMTHAEDLMQVFELAKRNDATYQAAVAQYQAQKEVSSLAWSAVLPQVNLQGAHSEFDEDRTIGNLTTSRSYDSDSFSVTLTQTIYRQEQFDRISQASAEVAAAQANFDNAAHDLIIRVAQQYFIVLGATDNLDFAKAEKQAIEQQLVQARERFKVGLTAITDVHEAQARYDQAVASEIEAQNLLVINKERLQVITNQALEQLAALKDDAPLVSPEPADVNEWIKTAIDNNLLLLAADKNMQAARHALGVARSGHFPTLDLQADYTDFETSGGNFGAFQEDGTTVSLVLNFPLYLGGSVNSASRQAAASYEQARQQHELQRRVTVSGTRNAYLTVLSTISRVRALKQALLSTETALEATQAGYEVGTRTAVDVLNAQRELFRAERDYARARYDYYIETLRLKQSAGTLTEADLRQINTWLE
jgi:outer membrane protein